MGVNYVICYYMYIMLSILLTRGLLLYIRYNYNNNNNNFNFYSA